MRIRDLTREAAVSRLELLLRAPAVLADSRALLRPALARSFHLGHPVYDCLYLALAIRSAVPLITADERLVAAVRKSRKLACCVMRLAEVPES